MRGYPIADFPFCSSAISYPLKTLMDQENLFEQRIIERGVSNFEIFLEVARQLKRIADVLERIERK